MTHLKPPRSDDPFERLSRKPSSLPLVAVSYELLDKLFLLLCVVPFVRFPPLLRWVRDWSLLLLLLDPLLLPFDCPLIGEAIRVLIASFVSVV
jgi:hypothetical protein